MFTFFLYWYLVDPALFVEKTIFPPLNCFGTFDQLAIDAWYLSLFSRPILQGQYKGGHESTCTFALIPTQWDSTHEIKLFRTSQFCPRRKMEGQKTTYDRNYNRCTWLGQSFFAFHMHHIIDPSKQPCDKAINMILMIWSEALRVNWLV